MPPKAAKQILFKIDTPEQYAEITSAENSRLVVIDLHLAWCNACQIMEQNYRSMYFAYENADSRIAFYTAAEDAIPQDVMTGLKYGALTCKPRFVVYSVSSYLDLTPCTL